MSRPYVGQASRRYAGCLGGRDDQAEMLDRSVDCYLAV